MGRGQPDVHFKSFVHAVSRHDQQIASPDQMCRRAKRRQSMSHDAVAYKHVLALYAAAVVDTQKQRGNIAYG